jgi:hypothetical protein
VQAGDQPEQRDERELVLLALALSFHSRKMPDCR